MPLDALLQTRAARATGKAALIGAIVGATAGVMVAAPSLREHAQPLWLVLQAVGLGGVIGAATGYFFRQIIIGQLLHQSTSRSSVGLDDSGGGDGGDGD
ncbi:MAG: hypothetical protein KDI37_03495 [Xanthomonadales bacterium]|nr:hypothetical protein [Xanthomonadales bacterium]MCB1626160.1 hypothetical protein [Xanthomonadales bacterium]MCB1635961.1 hypothetical protein [Xanthomonadales bacterium]MCB1640770.1 hypothetical protein [Xanthomonadales bacterium]